MPETEISPSEEELISGGKKLAESMILMWLKDREDTPLGKVLKSAADYLKDPNTGDWMDALWLTENKVGDWHLGMLQSEKNPQYIPQRQLILNQIDTFAYSIRKAHDNFRDGGAYIMLSVNRAAGGILSTSPLANAIRK